MSLVLSDRKKSLPCDEARKTENESKDTKRREPVRNQSHSDLIGYGIGDCMSTALPHNVCPSRRTKKGGGGKRAACRLRNVSG